MRMHGRSPPRLNYGRPKLINDQLRHRRTLSVQTLQVRRKQAPSYLRIRKEARTWSAQLCLYDPLVRSQRQEPFRA